MLKGRHVLLGVTGGIAAYKAADLVSRIKKQGADVRVVLTRHACEFVAPLTFETLSGNRAYMDSFERKFEIEHIALAKWADVFVIAPATANCLGKFANGIADDLLSTTFMAVTCPILMAPAMNANMYRSAAAQANLAILKRRGVRMVGPECGNLACGDQDIGRMSEPETILKAIDKVFYPVRDLEGKRVLVTAGPTVERIDPVRYLTNRSSGKMGYELACAARNRGAQVTLISGPTNLEIPKGMQVIRVESSAQLCEAVLANGPENHIVLQAAAPADYTPETVSDTKIKKDGGEMTLKLVPTRDIAKALGETKRPGQLFVIFAAETNDVLENARAKLVKKNADLVCANDVTQKGAGFACDTNILTLISREDARSLPLMSKKEAADEILNRVLELMGKPCATQM